MTNGKRIQTKTEELREQKIVYLMSKLDEEFGRYKDGLKRMPPERIINEAQMLVCMQAAYDSMYYSLNDLPDHRLNAIWDCENPIRTVATHLYNDKCIWEDMDNLAEDIRDVYLG